jgi:hypothetical protein
MSERVVSTSTACFYSTHVRAQRSALKNNPLKPSDDQVLHGDHGRPSCSYVNYTYQGRTSFRNIPRIFTKITYTSTSLATRIRTTSYSCTRILRFRSMDYLVFISFSSFISYPDEYIEWLGITWYPNRYVFSI